MRPNSLRASVAVVLLCGPSACLAQAGNSGSIQAKVNVVAALMLAGVPDSTVFFAVDSAAMQQRGGFTPGMVSAVVSLLGGRAGIAEPDSEVCDGARGRRCVRFTLRRAEFHRDSAIVRASWNPIVDGCTGGYEATFTVAVAHERATIVRKTDQTSSDCGPR